MADYTPEKCLQIFADVYAALKVVETPEAREGLQAQLYMAQLAFYMMTEHVDQVPTCQAPEDINVNDAILIDGTWWQAGDNGELWALDDLDCLWYDVDIVDDDPDIMLYYLDIRAQCLAQH